MKNWKDIPIPEMMKDLEKDKRGYPIPFIVARDKNNIPRFQINDHWLVEKCLAEKLCSVCGKPLNDDMWLVGGPMSAFHPQGSYIDPPGHEHCIKYSLQVCPYLINVNYKKRIDLANVVEGDFPESMVFVDETMDETRVPFFVTIKLRSYRIVRYSISERYIVPDRNYLVVEFWNGGVKITSEEADKLYQEHLKNPKKGVK